MSEARLCTYPNCKHLALLKSQHQHAEEEFFSNLLARAPGIFYIYDVEERKNIYLNEGYEAVCGYSAAEIQEMGTNLWHKVMHPDDFERVMYTVAPQYISLKPDGQIQFECRVKTKQGDWIWLECKERLLSQTSQGFTKQIIGTAQDITHRKQTEEELLRYRNHLEELAAARTAELKRSNEDLEQFASLASHDLREPLAFVASSMRALVHKCKLKHSLPKEDIQLVDHSLSALDRMQAIIKELLDYSRVGTQSKRILIDCRRIVRDVLIDLESLIKENNADIVYNGLPVVQGDPLQLQRVFQNLISNAIKYRSKEPLIIDITHEDLITEWTFCIRDNGIGIPIEEHNNLFKMFHRLHANNSRAGSEVDGTGIGLSVCKRIIQQHGGRIWVESDIDAGSAFYFTLPKLKPS